MPDPSRSQRITVPVFFLAMLCGSLAGLVTFAATATLWRAGQTRMAGLAAETVLLLALGCLAAYLLLARPPHRPRVRVPVGRALPHPWWSQEVDQAPVLAVCAGTPVIAAATAAVLLFR